MPVDVTPFATGLGAGPSRCGLLDTGPVALETASTGLVRFVPVAPFPTPALFPRPGPERPGPFPASAHESALRSKSMRGSMTVYMTSPTMLSTSPSTVKKNSVPNMTG